MSQAELFAGESALPPGLVYMPGFVSQAEECALLEGIAALDLREVQYKEFTEYRPGTQLGWHRDAALRYSTTLRTRAAA